MTIKPQRSRKIMAVTFACAFGMASPAIGLLPSATAERPVITGTSGEALPPASEINVQSARLTVIVRGGNPYDDVKPGELPPGGVQGYEFTAKRVNLDTSTQAGLNAAVNLTIAEAKKHGFTDTFTATSNAEGHAEFGELPAGVYLVTAAKPSDPTKTWVDHEDVLIILPTVAYGEWNHDVEIYAKPTSPDKPITPPDIPYPGPTPTPNTPPSDPPHNPPAPNTPQTPGTPPETPTQPGQPGQPGQSEERGGFLASTGASVIGLVAVALGLIGIGAVLMKRKRSQE